MRRLTAAVAMTTALLVGGASLAGCGNAYADVTAAQKKTCKTTLKGSFTGTVETDGDVKCDYRTKRRECKDPWEKIVKGGRFGFDDTIITCRVEILPSGKIDKD